MPLRRDLLPWSLMMMKGRPYSSNTSDMLATAFLPFLPELRENRREVRLIEIRTRRHTRLRRGSEFKDRVKILLPSTLRSWGSCK